MVYGSSIWNKQNNIDMMWATIQIDAQILIESIDFQNPTPEDTDKLISLFDFLEKNIPPVSATDTLARCISDILVKLEESIRYSQEEYNPDRVLLAYMLQGLIYLLGYQNNILGDYFNLQKHGEIHLNLFFIDEETHIDYEVVESYSRFLNVAYRYTLTIPELLDIPILAHYAVEQLIETKIEELEIKLENPDVYFGRASEMNKTKLQAQIDALKELLFLVSSEEGIVQIPATAAATFPIIKVANRSTNKEEVSEEEDDEYVIPDDKEVFDCLVAYALLEKDALEFVKRHIADKNIAILVKFFEYIVEQIYFSLESQDIIELEKIFKAALNLLIELDPQLALKVIPGPRERIMKIDPDEAHKLLRIAETIVDLSKFISES